MKQILRQKYRQIRRALTDAQQRQAAQQLVIQFQQAEILTNCEHIGLYIANDGEINPELIYRQLVASDKQVSLPCLDTTGANQLLFATVTADTIWSKNRFGIDEPSIKNLIDPKTLDVVLMPLVAFDETGRRLGMGGGFYDRTFAFKLNDKGQRPRLIGLAHECQKADKLSCDHWDIPLDGILTDQRYLDLT